MTIETKLQIEALKRLEKGERIPAYAKDGACFYLTLDGFYAFRICKEHFWLNPEVLKEMSSLPPLFSPDRLSDASELTVTNEMRKRTQSMGVLLKCDNFTTCIDDKFLKMFMDKSCKLYAMSEKTAVYFVRNDEIYAVVMPINLGKQEVAEHD